MLNTQKDKLVDLSKSSEIQGFYEPMILNAAKTVLESEEKVAVARSKTDSIPFKELNLYLKFFADTKLTDDDLKNFELFEEVSVLVDLTSPLKRPNSSESSSEEENEKSIKEDSSSPSSPSSPSDGDSSDLKLKNSIMPKRKKKSPAVNERASCSKTSLNEGYSPSSSPVDYISTGRYSQISWISGENPESRSVSPTVLNQSPKRRRESPMTKWSDATRFGLDSRTKIIQQQFNPILNHPDVNYRGHLPHITLIATSSVAGASLFNLLSNNQMFGFLSVDKKGSRPVNYGSTFRAAVNIKEVGKIRWPNNKLDLWFVKASVLNIESTERNSVRFFSNISKTRPY